MLRRAGFGASGHQVDAVVGQDWSAYLDAALGMDPESDPGAIATPMPKPVTPPVPGDGAGKQEHTEFAQTLFGQMQELSAWWLRRMAAVQQPIHEKLTMVWHNHFATSAEKVAAAELMALQNQRLRSLHSGDFQAFAHAMLTDAAMQLWLDGNTNTKAAPNENLSREFMELFTLGHGNGYTEVDVREGARALTGWMTSTTGQTALSADNHDAGPKTILGVTGDFNESDFCNIAVNHPSSAPFVATKMWRSLASDNAPSDATLGRLIGAYGPNRDLRALTKAVFLDPEFNGAAGTVVNAPVEWLVGLIRSLAIPMDKPEMISAANVVLIVMGQRPFYPPDVGGWPRGSVWLSSTSVAARVWAADQLVPQGNISIVESAGPNDRVDAAGYLIGIGAWTDRTAAALKELSDDPQRLVAAALNAPEYLTS
ncbi:MAG: DUF1800 domain-containing protein [Mycobacterium sp.]